MINLLYLLILVLGFPTGVLLARLCHDEIEVWKNRFLVISVVSLVLALLVSFFNFEYKLPVIIGLFFAIIVWLTVAWKNPQ